MSSRRSRTTVYISDRELPERFRECEWLVERFGYWVDCTDGFDFKLGSDRGRYGHRYSPEILADYHLLRG